MNSSYAVNRDIISSMIRHVSNEKLLNTFFKNSEPCRELMAVNSRRTFFPKMESARENIFNPYYIYLCSFKRVKFFKSFRMLCNLPYAKFLIFRFIYEIISYEYEAGRE
jgi:hypothetical protein